MDKQEYKLKAEEIKVLISKREFQEAVKIADQIDWKRVRSVAMLCTVSDLYKVNRRYQESKELLLMAYGRHSGGRMILYSLCELCIKTGEVVEAIEYYKEFVQLVPMDNGKYVLQYKIYEAQDVSLEERIAVLEELKKREYREKWGYELAYLYHRIGLVTKCVEECDQLILWFGEGRYVKKAMELKMVYEPLSRQQQESYVQRMGGKKVMPPPQAKVQPKPEVLEKKESSIESTEQPKPVIEVKQETKQPPMDDLEIQVKPVKVGKYDTINLQKALAESMKEVLAPNAAEGAEKNDGEIAQEPVTKEPIVEQNEEGSFPDGEKVQEIFFEDYTAEIPLGLEEPNQIEQEQLGEDLPEYQEEGRKRTEQSQNQPFQSVQQVQENQAVVQEDLLDATKELPSLKDLHSIREVMELPLQEEKESREVCVEKVQREASLLMEIPLQQQADSAAEQKDSSLKKQSTGSWKAEEVLVEWERTKKENEEKRKAELTEKILSQTGRMFTTFEEKIRDGILEQLEKEERQRRAALHPASEIQAKQTQEPKPQDADLPYRQEIQKVLAQAAGLEVLEKEEVDFPEEQVKEQCILSEKLPKEEVHLPKETILEESTLLEELLGEEDCLLQESPETEREIRRIREAELGTRTIAVVDSEPMDEPKREQKVVKQINREIKPVEDHGHLRELTEEEKGLFAAFIQTRGERRRFVHALDRISLAAYGGNVILAGERSAGTMNLAKHIMKYMQMKDEHFSGAVAKVTGASLNSRNVDGALAKLSNGGLIVEKASGMNSLAVAKLLRALDQNQAGIVVILEDNKRAIKRMLAAYPALEEVFDARIELEELSNDALAEYGRQYAYHKDYAIDALGMLALQTQIEDRQTSDHMVTVMEVRELVDQAIARADRRNVKHLFDLLLGKRYDEEDMIILRERDFV